MDSSSTEPGPGGEHAAERAEVVIIDDNQINLKLLEFLLAKDGRCRPRSFLDPRDGLAHCLAEPPDLLIVDYMMPELNGLDVIQQLRANPATADIPILMVTANDQRDIRHAALEIGATDFLTKPIDNKELFARAHNMLRLRAATKREANRAQWLAEAVKEATAEIQAREQELIYRISRAAEFRDPETGGHIQRMAHYSRLIAQALGQSPAEQELIFMAAPMHDVGKIAIPDSILLKPGKLTDEEFVIMKTHARAGHDLLADSRAPVLVTGAEIAHCHHEKFDGSGYPRGLAGTDIPVTGRIVAVADVFDALTSSRPYKTAWSLDAARDWLQKQKGSHFDPDCVDAFLSVWDEVVAIHQRIHDH